MFRVQDRGRSKYNRYQACVPSTLREQSCAPYIGQTFSASLPQWLMTLPAIFLAAGRPKGKGYPRDEKEARVPVLQEELVPADLAYTWEQARDSNQQSQPASPAGAHGACRSSGTLSPDGVYFGVHEPRVG